MHRLIASPFLKQHLLVRPGSRGGVLLPAPRYEELRALDPAEPSPSWFADSIRDQWADLDLVGRPAGEYPLVRQPSTWGYSRASWEINSGATTPVGIAIWGSR